MVWYPVQWVSSSHCGENSVSVSSLLESIRNDKHFFPELNNLACREQCFFAAHGKCAARPSDVLFKAA